MHKQSEQMRDNKRLRTTGMTEGTPWQAGVSNRSTWCQPNHTPIPVNACKKVPFHEEKRTSWGTLHHSTSSEESVPARLPFVQSSHRLSHALMLKHCCHKKKIGIKDNSVHASTIQTGLTALPMSLQYCVAGPLFYSNVLSSALCLPYHASLTAS